MTPSVVANVLMISIVIAMWSYLIFRGLPNYRVDAFRQKMFCLRDELFDYAAEGNIRFDDPAYVLLRRQMNGFIRYGHQLTVFRLLMTKLMNMTSGDSNPTQWNDAWTGALANLENDEVRERLQAFHEITTIIVIKHLIIGSPLLWLAMSLVGLALLFHGAARGTHQLLRVAASKVMVGPLDRRLIEEAAAASLP